MESMSGWPNIGYSIAMLERHFSFIGRPKTVQQRYALIVKLTIADQKAELSASIHYYVPYWSNSQSHLSPKHFCLKSQRLKPLAQLQNALSISYEPWLFFFPQSTGEKINVMLPKWLFSYQKQRACNLDIVLISKRITVRNVPCARQ